MSSQQSRPESFDVGAAASKELTVNMLRQCLLAESADELESLMFGLGHGDVSRLLAQLDEHERILLWERLSPTHAAHYIEEIPFSQAAEELSHLSTSVAADILDELPSDEQADFLGEMDELAREAVIEEMEDPDVEGVRELTNYDDDVAGGLMRREYLSFHRDLTVSQLVENMRSRASELARFDVQYAYVTDAAGVLVGVLRLRDLLVTPAETRVDSIMFEGIQTVSDHASLEDLELVFDRVSFVAVPAVDDTGQIVGVVRRIDVEEALGERSEEEFLKSQGIVGGDELRSMPMWGRAGRRLSWLSVNVVLNIIAASVIAAKQDTLEAVIALAVFLPIISDMSGCTGNQAVAVSLRELALGVIRPKDALWVLRQEVGLGLINGLSLGLLLGAVGWIWQDNMWFGLVVGGAMALNSLIAVCIGGTVPVILKRFKADPALASGPILTTITDVCGFFIVLSLASWGLAKLA